MRRELEADFLRPKSQTNSIAATFDGQKNSSEKHMANMISLELQCFNSTD